MTTTYSAWFVVRRGPPAKALPLKAGLPIPAQLSKGHVLVKVQATALNPLGYKTMRAVPNFLAGRPHVAEHDVAGIVVDPNGSEFSAGDKVFGFSPSSKLGTLAEHVVLPSSSLALVTILKMESGRTVFVNGGSSGVGLAAIQIAKALGCKVVATAASGKNKELLLSLGVDEFIDYTQAPLTEQLISNLPSPKFHAILDGVGLTDPTLYINSASYLAPDGTYLTVGTVPMTRKEIADVLRLVGELFRPTWLGGVPRKHAFGFSFVATRVNRGKKDLEMIRDLAANGTVKPIVESVHSFDQVGVVAAYEKLMSKRAMGKVVVKVEKGCS
ncbi:NAD(P)-binding protein [Mycena epipterygia]|nr:NAD(P)-binding protein [Mycena epipterygia]